MSELQEKTFAKSLAKGLLAGLIGGLVATAAKSFAERIFPPRTHGEPEPPAVLAEKMAGHSLAGGEKVTAEEAIHWGFGAMTGAAYGALAEYYPAATVKDGAGFGMALDSLTHGTALPAIELSAEPAEQTFREKTSEMASHVVFGMVTETVRRFVRKMLG
jgi:putative membrane protein